MYVYNAGSKNVKEQLDFSDILFKQIDRIGIITLQPEFNITQFGTAVDVLAGMVSFLGKINYESNPSLPLATRYKDTMKAFEEIILLLDTSGLLFKYRIRGHIGKGESGQ